MHLEQYLKITNQYLHSTLDGANMTSNEQINHLIRTNILTNKIAANNLISIINKLLEQNIISEYYFKHASRLMMQSYDGMSIGDNNGLIDGNKDALHASSTKRKAMSSPSTTPSPQPNVQSELLKQLAKRQFHESQEYDGDGTDGDASGDNSLAAKNELPDYDDTIKKETIPIASSPFISYLHLHFNRDLAGKHKASTPPKFFNGTNMSTALSPPSDSTSPISPLLAPIKAKHKSHKNHSDSSNSNSSSNNNNYSKSAKHHIPYDLSLSLNQRLTQDIKFHLSILHFKPVLIDSHSRNRHVNKMINPFLFTIFRSNRDQEKHHHHHQQQVQQSQQQSWSNYSNLGVIAPILEEQQQKQQMSQQQQHQQQKQQQMQQQQEQINEKKKPHIKKPLNAFMLYMKEMRAKVVAECTLKESAAINQILGRRVSHIVFCYYLHSTL